jgi:hypothetical protein
MLTSMTFWAVVAAAALLVGATIRMNVRGARRERAIVTRRGQQTAADFATLFKNGVEQCVARELFQPLQSLTFSHSYSFRPDDELFGYPSTLQQLFPSYQPNLALAIDDEDLGDEIVRVFRRFGIPKEDIDWEPFQSMRTVLDLVTAIATVVQNKDALRSAP